MPERHLKTNSSVTYPSAWQEMKMDFSSLIDANVIPLSNYKNLQYTGTAFIGNPSQEITFMFDTGSAKLWTYGKEHCSV